eukprot:311317-Chlamydomonas_euryale.AAC.1
MASHPCRWHAGRQAHGCRGEMCWQACSVNPNPSMITTTTILSRRMLSVCSSEQADPTASGSVSGMPQSKRGNRNGAVTAWSRPKATLSRRQQLPFAAT